MTAIDQLKSVLCDPEGKCCIAGSDEDRAIIDRALDALAKPDERNFCPRCGKRTADLTAIHTCTPPQPMQEDSCFCHDGASLQMVSGGAAPEGYLGRVTLLIDGEYVDYVKAQPVQPERQWVGLTDTERNDIWKKEVGWGDPSHDDEDLMKAIEAKLKEKNGL